MQKTGMNNKISLVLLFSHITRYHDIFWIDASTDASISLSFDKIATAKGLAETSKDSVIQWISNLKTTWLMVFDNADGGYELVENHIPSGNNGSILITSRDKMLERVTSSDSLEIQQMEEEDAITLLLKCGELKADFRGSIKKIVLILGCVPLAIDQAGAYMHACQSDPDDYLQLYERHHKELLSQQPHFKAASGYKHSAYETWEISMREIAKRAGSNDRRMSDAAHSALTLLNMFAFLHHEQISEEIFSLAAKNWSQRGNYVNDSLPQVATSLTSEALFLNEQGEWDKIRFLSGIKPLLSFSLIRGANKLYSVHSLVHRWSQDRLSSPSFVDN
jgi:hypothetical protein